MPIHKSPASLDEGMGRILTPDQIRALFEGQAPAKLPDVIMYGDDRALVRSIDHSMYYKLVLEGGYWYCGCEVGRFCLHTEAVQTSLASKPQSQLTRQQRLAQVQRDHHWNTLHQVQKICQHSGAEEQPEKGEA